MPQKVLHTAAYFLVALMAIAAILAGVTSDVIDVDAAQYAAISMEMLQKNTFLFVTERGIDYLDKPPLLFWVNSLFLKIFGFTNFGYKIGTLLASSLTNPLYIQTRQTALHQGYWKDCRLHCGYFHRVCLGQ
jgi:4-amino-4-deoxy-L-arabinose transferase-like glycosyltransferase